MRKYTKHRKSIVFLSLWATLFLTGFSNGPQSLTDYSSNYSSPGRDLASLPKDANVSVLRAQDDPYGTVLLNIKAPPKEGGLNEFLFDKKIAKKTSEHYQQMVDDLEFKKNYQLDGLQDYIAYDAENRHLLDEAVKELIQYHSESTLKKVEKADRANSRRRTAKKGESHSVGSGSGGAISAAISTARAIRNTAFNLGENTKAKFKYNIPRGEAKFTLTGDLINSSVNYRVKPAAPGVGSADMPEKLTVSMGKHIEGIHASTGANYGVNHKILNTYVSKQLVGPISAQVDHVRNITSPDRDETIYRLNFGTSF